MAVQALKASPEDFPALAVVHGEAFEGNPLNKLIAPKGNTPASREIDVQTMHMQLEDPSTHFLKAVDSETGEIVGMARWNIYLSGRSDEEMSSSKPPRPEKPEINVELRNNMVELLEKSRRETMGQRPHCALNILAVSPKFQRRGAGGVLLQWGLDIADRENIEASLESTVEGHGLYERFGFRDIDTLKLDVGKWTGIEGDTISFPVMLRSPQGRGENQPN